MLISIVAVNVIVAMVLQPEQGSLGTISANCSVILILEHSGHSPKGAQRWVLRRPNMGATSSELLWWTEGTKIGKAGYLEFRAGKPPKVWMLRLALQHMLTSPTLLHAPHAAHCKVMY